MCWLQPKQSNDFGLLTGADLRDNQGKKHLRTTVSGKLPSKQTTENFLVGSNSATSSARDNTNYFTRRAGDACVCNPSKPVLLLLRGGGAAVFHVRDKAVAAVVQPTGDTEGHLALAADKGGQGPPTGEVAAQSTSPLEPAPPPLRAQPDRKLSEGVVVPVGVDLVLVADPLHLRRVCRNSAAKRGLGVVRGESVAEDHQLVVADDSCKDLVGT